MDQFILSGIICEYPNYGIPAAIFLLVIIGYLGSPLFVWTLAGLGLLVGCAAPMWLLLAFAVLMFVFNVKPLRRLIATKPVMGLMRGFMPKISETERTALEAGVVWVEKDLFSGAPDFKKVLDEPYPRLTPEEQAFLSGPTEKLCSMIDAWKIWKTREMEQVIWDYMKKENSWV